MKCCFDIDYFKRTTTIERKSYTFSTSLNRNTIQIDRVIALWFLEKQRKNISIDKEKYKVISFHIPYFSDWVILQNDYLPLAGEYFLN